MKLLLAKLWCLMEDERGDAVFSADEGLASMEKERQCFIPGSTCEISQGVLHRGAENSTRTGVTRRSRILEMGKPWEGWGHAGTHPAGRGARHFHGIWLVTQAQGDIFQCAGGKK